jgi:hypothetical protein
MMGVEGKKYHFQKGGGIISFPDQNIDPWLPNTSGTCYTAALTCTVLCMNTDNPL